MSLLLGGSLPRNTPGQGSATWCPVPFFSAVIQQVFTLWYYSSARSLCVQNLRQAGRFVTAAVVFCVRTNAHR